MYFGFRHMQDKVDAAQWEHCFAWLPIQLTTAEPGRKSEWVWLDWYWRKYQGDWYDDYSGYGGRSFIYRKDSPFPPA